MNARKTAADVLRDKYMSSHLKKVATDTIHPNMAQMYGVEYLFPEIEAKIHNPLFNSQKYVDLGTVPPRSVLIRGISGVGKSYLIRCFCQQHRIPLVTGMVDSTKDIRELFSRSKSTERSIILIRNIEQILAEEALIHQLNESISVLDWCAIVAITHTDTLDRIKYDNEVFVKIPTVAARKEMLDGLLAGMQTRGLDTWKIAQNTPGFVPRDIVKLLTMVSTLVVSRCTEGSLKMLENVTISSTHRETGNDLVIKMEDVTECIQQWKNITENITFDDIGALKTVKEELTMSILLPSRYPEKFASLGISRPSGVLLHGPPGCGKTLIAKAVSNMSHCNFLSIKGPELITKYVGDSEKHLRDLFQKAKNLSPCVLFFDEIDSLCSRRGKNEFGNRIVNQILTLLDGMEDRGEVYLIGATNRIDSIDSALLRPGRFDKVIEVALPGSEEAVEIFKKCVSRIPHEKFEYGGLALGGMTGAEISGAVKEAATMCLMDNFEADDLRIARRYFEAAIAKMGQMRRNKR